MTSTSTHKAILTVWNQGGGNTSGGGYDANDNIQEIELDADTSVGYDLLTGVTRGTLGTSAIAHLSGSVIVDGGRRQQIPGVPDYWDYLNTIDSSVTALAHTHTAFNDLGVTLHSSTNTEANFINAPTDGGTIRSGFAPANSW